MKKYILSALILMAASLQSAFAQGFCVYQSDGTKLQFSLSTDSIVFDNGLSGDEVFGPFTPVNQCIAKKWYKSKTETVTFNADGTTDFLAPNSLYKFFPYQGTVVIFNSAGAPVYNFRILEVTADKMLVSEYNDNSVTVWATTPQPVLVQEIILSNVTLTLKPNDTKDLIATVLPYDADNTAVTWESSDEEVAEVSKKGKVIANAVGTCVITCRATDGSGVYAQCEVTVTNVDIKVTEIILSETTISLGVGKEYQLNALVFPNEATNKDVTWESSNESFAKVDATGLVKGINTGTSTITCRATDGSGVYAECHVSVGEFGMTNGHEWVKIGGKKWATMNVGAVTVAGSYATCFGDYFAWGETEPRYSSITRTFNNVTFTWKSGYSSGYYTNNRPDYTGDILDESHDAATANWGNDWCTPTWDDFLHLVEACTGGAFSYWPIEKPTGEILYGGIYWLSADQTFEPAYTGVAGVLFVSDDNITHRVFFPASGSVSATEFYDGNVGSISWSAESHGANIAKVMRLVSTDESTELNIDDFPNFYGLTVRPVVKE